MDGFFDNMDEALGNNSAADVSSGDETVVEESTPDVLLEQEMGVESMNDQEQDAQNASNGADGANSDNLAAQSDD